MRRGKILTQGIQLRERQAVSIESHYFSCRNARGLDGRESIERRLKEAVELLKLITNGNAQPRYH